MNICWDYDNMALVRALTDPRPPSLITLPCRDIVPVDLYLASRSSIADAFTAGTLGDGETLVFKGKESPGDGDPLWSATADDWTLNSTTGAYEADVDLLTADMVTAITGKKKLRVYGELSIRDANDRDYYSTQFVVELINDVNREGDVTAAASDNAKFIDGVLHIYNATQDKWFPVRNVGAAGQETLEIGGTGVDG